ncbi:uncharacterized protein LOC141605209 [Silene latifolia]|uniref:uncharacterized protein LOC141605209 n=1 Tax=Silene latifolia TaxID=37657 RepID=UPI003D77F83A
MSSPFSKLGFRFLPNLQFSYRYFCNSAHYKATPIVDSRMFLDYVRQQCQLGFTNLQFPLNLFHQMMSLVRRPSITHFSRLFVAMLKFKRLHPHTTVISLFSHRDLSGTRHDLYSICILANCYCHLGRVDFGYSLLSKSLKLEYPFESDLVFFTTLINGLVHNNQFPQAVELFDVVVVKLGIQPDIFTYYTMVKGLCGIGDNAGAIHLLRQLNSSPLGCKPSLIMFNTIIHSLGKDKLLAEVKEMLLEMIESNIAPNVYTYNMLIHMQCKDGMIDEAQALIQIMTKQGVAPDVFTYNTLLNGYCLCGQMDKAREVFDLMIQTHCQPNVVTYGTLINGYVKLKSIDKAFDVLQEMFERGIAPDAAVYCTLIDGLCKSGRIPMARQLFNDMQIYEIKPDVCTYGSLLDGLCKNAQLDETKALLKEMECNGIAPDIVIYTILIDSLCEAGQVKDAEILVSDLLSRGMVPGHITYTTMI